MKIWQKKSTKIDAIIESFTIGKDPEFDLLLAPFDVLGSMAHAKMLAQIGILSPEEQHALHKELQKILLKIEEKQFKIEVGMEDIHSQIESILIQKLGETGKKIHTGRSRNDQVLVDTKLFIRHVIEEIINAIKTLFDTLIIRSENHKTDLLPGYTHFQMAMPSSFGLWFGAYAEALTDDIELLQTAFYIANKNPLGSGAGYGSSFPLDRNTTTILLGFNELDVNSVYAQMTRGKTELWVATAISAVATTLARLAMDIGIFTSQNFNFVTLPDELTTGSSIMPHKKNPDVVELLRGKFNKMKSLPNEIQFLLSNLPSGYHREMQLLKEILFPMIEEFQTALSITNYVCTHLKIKSNLLENNQYDVLFSVENVHQLVQKGYSFREAYQEVGQQIENQTYKPHRELHHAHIGSIGNLGNDLLINRMNEKIVKFPFKHIEDKLKELIG